MITPLSLQENFVKQLIVTFKQLLNLIELKQKSEKLCEKDIMLLHLSHQEHHRRGRGS